jgi:hypothetical protein
LINPFRMLDPSSHSPSSTPHFRSHSAVAETDEPIKWQRMFILIDMKDVVKYREEVVLNAQDWWFLKNETARRKNSLCSVTGSTTYDTIIMYDFRSRLASRFCATRVG